MDAKEVIKLLKERETDFLKTSSLSKLPGIYALFYIGNDFPLLGDSVSKHQIIYIGKTESSQEKRDLTHFTTGKTGSSTIRKSIGSILSSFENLTPIPRNDIDFDKGRFSHFKFDNPSEIKITNWMKNNLALSFYEYPESQYLLDKLETEIITVLIPALNIDYKNPNNPLKQKIKQLRKRCAAIALNNSKLTSLNRSNKEKKESKLQCKIFDSQDSNVIYIDNITKLDFESRGIRIKVKGKHIFPAEKPGKPITYNLPFKTGDIDFSAKYTIGSKDGKSRSGVLKLGDKVYQQILKIKIGTNLKIIRSKNNKYIIERLF